MYTVAISIIIVSLIILYRWANTSQSVTPTVLPIADKEGYSDNNQLAISTQYYSTTIRGSYRVLQRDSKGSGQVLDRFIATTSGTADKCQLAVTIAILPSDGLQGVADVNYRMTRPELFAVINLEAAPEGSLVFRGSSPDELDVFMVYDTRYAAIALSSTEGGGTKCGDSMSSVLDAWRWL